MTSANDRLSYASFCGTLLDDMLEQIIHTIITRSLLNEKLIRKDYGTIEKPIFHDPLFFQDSQSNSFSQTQTKIKENSKNVINIGEESDNEIGDYDNDKKRSNNYNNSINTNMVRYKEPDIGRFSFTLNGKDIYVNALNDNKTLLGPKANLIVIGTAQDTYFKCSNCDRKIAGSRFGAHIDKCLGGRSRK